MRVLVIGAGGREHALARGLAASKHVTQVVCAPGNAGTATIAENIDVPDSDINGLLDLAKERKIDLTVVGPEAPLCAGIVDRFESAGLRIFGPTAAAARIEGDKAFAKNLMKGALVPTADGRVFADFSAAREYVATRESGMVVKASGLAAGKGVIVCDDPAEALLALEKIMVDKAFGDAGSTVVVEDRLTGPELSIFALVDGRSILVLETAQDHKPIGDGDTGLNTGGMGAYSPAPIATDKVMRVIEADVLVPIVDALRQSGTSYKGLLYVGLMLTPAGPKVLEFNCRFGDPETQAVLIRLESDLFTLLSATVDGKLADLTDDDIRWTPKPAVCVVMASGGYPGDYEKGKVIRGLTEADAMDDVCVFHAGTQQIEHLPVTSGGRVLGVTALGQDIADARTRAYDAVAKIQFDHAYYRKDIAANV